MNPLRKIRPAIGSLFGKRRLDSEMEAEMRSHIELRTRERIESGMNPDEARFAALRQFGWTESIKEECRDRRGARWLENLIRDLRYGSRQLGKSPGFTIVAVLTLALGIGANTAIFGVINGVLLRPLAYHNPGRLVVVSQSSPKRGFSQVLVIPAVMRIWQEQNTDFEELGGEIYNSVNLTGVDLPEHLHAAAVTKNFFRFLASCPLWAGPSCRRTSRPEEEWSQS